MNKSIAAVLLGLLSLGAETPPVYQVITGHPHDLEKIQPHIETVKQDGRLWLVKLKDKVPTEAMVHLRLVGNEKLTSYQPKVRKSAKKNQQISDALKLVALKNLQDDIAKLSSFKTRLVGTDDNRSATAWAEEKLKSLGFATQQVCYERGACSVVADKVGKSESAEMILIIAHIDSVGKNFAGADDNASGTAALLEMARVLAQQEHPHSLRFLIANGEESGLLGSEHYAAQMASNGEIKKVALVINMDMVGYNKNGVVELETDAPWEDLAKEFAQLAADYTTLKTKITLGAWGSDHVPFLRKNVPSILTLENWDTKTPCYHLPCDKPDTINYPYATEITKLNVAAVLSKMAD